MKQIKNIIIPVACFLTLQGQVEAAAQTKEITSMKEIYLAGGCFWGTEHFLKQISGVKALYIERRYFLFVTYLIISRYRKAQT